MPILLSLNRSAAVAATLLVLAVIGGCGGGNAPPPPVEEPLEYSVELPDVPLSDYFRGDTFQPGAPVTDFGGTLHVGADVAPPAGALAASGMRNGVVLSEGSVRDGASAGDVVEYLELAASHNLSGRGTSGLATFHETQVKTVQVVFTDRTRNRFTPNVARLTLDAVRIVNSALPFGQQIRFNPEFYLDPTQPPGSPYGRGYGDILVWFIAKSDSQAVGRPAETSIADRARTRVSGCHIDEG